MRSKFNLSLIYAICCMRYCVIIALEISKSDLIIIWFSHRMGIEADVPTFYIITVGIQRGERRS